MKLALMLHFYQPPTQKESIVSRVIKESYEPILKLLEENPHVQTTVNVTGSLILLLIKMRRDDILKRIQHLYKKGNVEFVGSSAYHALLPRLDIKNARRQIEIQEDILKTYLGVSKPTGFFPPEMAYNSKVAIVVKKCGYSWLTADSYIWRGRSPAQFALYDKAGMRYVVRNRWLSFQIMSNDFLTHGEFVNKYEEVRGNNPYLFVAVDAEIFGHHRTQHMKLLQDIFEKKVFEVSTVGAVVKLPFPKKMISPNISSWTPLDHNRSVKMPFMRWYMPDNEIQRMQWRLTRLAVRADHNEESQKLLDRALFSCQYWWSSGRPWWQIELIESGAHSLLDSVIQSKSRAVYKQKAVSLYNDILKSAFSWMRSGKMQQFVDVEHTYMQKSENSVRKDRV